MILGLIMTVILGMITVWFNKKYMNGKHFWKLIVLTSTWIVHTVFRGDGIYELLSQL